MQGPTADDRQYRRGVVLGLTMAEIMLLLIFLLMLLLAAKLANERKARADIEAQRDRVTEELIAIKAVVEQLKAIDPKSFDITKEYIKAQKDLEQAKAEAAEATKILELISEIKKNNPKLSTEDAKKLLEERVKLGEVVAEAAKGEDPTKFLDKLIKDAAIGSAIIKSGKSPEDLLASAASCKAELQTCVGQVKNLSSRLGGDLPSCWTDQNGNQQYIFSVTLRDAGIFLTDNKIPGREADEAALPISEFAFGIAYEPGAFFNAGAKLKAWSVDKKCRFFVRVHDETGVDQKSRYKALLDGVENVFYKHIEK